MLPVTPFCTSFFTGILIKVDVNHKADVKNVYTTFKYKLYFKYKDEKKLLKEHPS